MDDDAALNRALALHDPSWSPPDTSEFMRRQRDADGRMDLTTAQRIVDNPQMPGLTQARWYDAYMTVQWDNHMRLAATLAAGRSSDREVAACASSTARSGADG